MSSGIYSIICLMNGKIYIGSAINIQKRWRVHKSHLNLNKHHSKYLQRTWNKYGEDYFDWNIIELCKIEDLIQREQYYLDYMEPEFNNYKIAGSPLGCKRSKEYCKKLSKRMKGNINTLGKLHTNEQCVKISQTLIGNRNNVDRNRRFCDEEINIIRKSCKTQQELAKEYGTSNSTISRIILYQVYKDVK